MEACTLSLSIASAPNKNTLACVPTVLYLSLSLALLDTCIWLVGTDTMCSLQSHTQPVNVEWEASLAWTVDGTARVMICAQKHRVTKDAAESWVK